jgi:hypothetical protein
MFIGRAPGFASQLAPEKAAVLAARGRRTFQAGDEAHFHRQFVRGFCGRLRLHLAKDQLGNHSRFADAPQVACRRELALDVGIEAIGEFNGTERMSK